MRRTDRRPTGRHALLLTAGAVLVCAGCSGRPRAPALGNEPVYENKREGFRFVAPDDWVQRAKADVPAGKADKEHLLVNYRSPARDKVAFLEVSLADMPGDADLAGYLADNSFGVSKWRPSGAPQPIDVNGTDAIRYSYTARLGRDELTKEVVVFRRGERVYFFTSVYPSNDHQSRDQLRRAATSTIWDG